MRWAGLCLLFAAACGDSATSAPPDAAPPPLGGESCPDLSCVPCGNGEQCAADGPTLEATCCAAGDDLIEVGAAQLGEAVDIEFDGTRVYMCGGFGGGVYDISDRQNPVTIGPIGGRCQRIAIGPVLADGTQVVYVAHHGDSRWVFSYLYTYHVTDDGQIDQVHGFEDGTEVLYEGLEYADGALYVAAHGGGVRVYSVDDQGIPTFVDAVDGFGNAWKVAVDGPTLYVADQEDGLHVLDVSDVLAPTRIAQLALPGGARDVEVHDGRAFVAMGATGLQVVDVGDPSAPFLRDLVHPGGSAQAVAVNDQHLAVASWTHVALLDPITLETVATNRVQGALEQNVAIELDGADILAVEWGSGLHVMRYRPGYVAPDLWLREAFYSFDGDRIEARAVVLENRGLLPLEVSVELDDPAYFLSRTELLIQPGEADVFEVTFLGVRMGDLYTDLLLHTNDPDSPLVEVPIRSDGGDKIGLGDQIDERFGFLDPDGAGQVGGLEGHVVLLVYFGLF